MSYANPTKPRLLDQVCAAIRTRHYSYRTEEAYVGWVKRFILFHRKRHPAEMGKSEIEQFLTALAVDRHVTASTQNQALAAILFLYKDVLERDPGWLDDVVRARRPERLPTVLTRPEVEALLGGLGGVNWIMATLLYGAGLRLMECLGLRVKDIDFTRNEILVREGKGNKDRVTMLPSAVIPRLRLHLERVGKVHHTDLAAGYGRGRPAGCFGAQVSERESRVGVAVGVSGLAHLRRSALRPTVAVSFARVGPPAGYSRGGASGGDGQASRPAHSPA